MPDRAMTADAIRVGFFGKLPSRGDFVRVALSRALIEAWDRWFRPLLPAAQGRLGEAWNDVWHTTRPWRFAMSAGLCGANPLSGVWLPSADRVGREFPLTIAAEAFAPCDSFLDAAEELGREAIRTHMTPDILAQRLALLPCTIPFVPPAETPVARWWRRRDEGDGESLCGDRLPDVDVFVGMLTP